AILAAGVDFMPVGWGVLSGQYCCQPRRAGLAAAARQLGTAAVGGLMRGSAPAMDGGNAGFAGAKTGPRAPIARNLSSRSSLALNGTCCLIRRHGLRPRIVRRVVRHDPRPVHPGGPVNVGSFRRAIGADKTAAATPVWLYWARYARKTKKGQGNGKGKLFRPQAAKSDSGC